MLDLWVRTPEEKKNYNLPKWQNKTQRKVMAEKYQLIPIFLEKTRYLFSTNEAFNTSYR
jgi:hypothetical protein